MPSLESIQQARAEFGLDATKYPDVLFMGMSSLYGDNQDISEYFGSPEVQASILAKKRDAAKLSAIAVDPPL